VDPNVGQNPGRLGYGFQIPDTIDVCIPMEHRAKFQLSRLFKKCALKTELEKQGKLNFNIFEENNVLDFVININIMYGPAFSKKHKAIFSNVETTDLPTKLQFFQVC
jgi:hypothetical protein